MNNQNYLIDSHCHLHDTEFFSPEIAKDYLLSARQNNVQKIICIGTNHEDSLEAMNFSSNHDRVFWTYGFHPSEVEKYHQNHSLSEFEKLLSEASDLITQKPPCAIGEIGLDYHYQPYDRELQIKAFEYQIDLANHLNLPIVFHIREAFDDFFAVIKNFPTTKGVVHSFSDSKQNLNYIINSTPFFIGINGIATFTGIPKVPLDRVLLETDAPFLTPIPHRGKQNQPAYIKDIAEFLANKYSTDLNQIASITTNNSEKLFSI